MFRIGGREEILPQVVSHGRVANPPLSWIVCIVVSLIHFWRIPLLYFFSAFCHCSGGNLGVKDLEIEGRWLLI